MWIVGTIVLLVVGAAVIAAIGWRPRPAARNQLWDISGLGGVYVGIIGTLAGFSIGSATFIAGLIAARGLPEFAAAIGMLLVSFLTLLAAAMMYSDTPSFPASDADFESEFQGLSHVFAYASYYLGLALAWHALRPLLLTVELRFLADAFTWLLLGTVLAGNFRTAVFVYRLIPAGRLACVALPLLGIGLPVIYRLVAARVWPALWPASNAAIWMAFVAFGVEFVGFVHQTALLLFYGGAGLEQRVRRHGHRFALAYVQMVLMAIALIWLAVATS